MSSRHSEKQLEAFELLLECRYSVQDAAEAVGIIPKHAERLASEIRRKWAAHARREGYSIPNTTPAIERIADALERIAEALELRD